jgi:hypothetical protein
MIADFIQEASVRLEISKGRLAPAVHASRVLSKAELEVVTSLTEFAQSGTPMKKRKAVSRAILNVLRTIHESGDDPLTEGAVSALLLAEIEIQTGHSHMS